MNHFRRLTSMVLAVLTLGLCAHSRAQTPSAPRIQSVALAADGQMDALVYTGTDSNLQAADVQVTLGGQTVAGVTVASYDRSGSGTTWLFIVDTPKAMNAAAFKLLRQTVAGLAALMGEGDNAGIITPGMPQEQFALLQDAGEIVLQSQTLSQKNNDDTLYAAVQNACDFLATSGEARKHANLVILSTGDKHDESIIALSKLQSMIDESRLTAYTFAFLSGSVSKDRQGQIDVYGGLARQSCGGLEFQIASGAGEIDSELRQIQYNEQRFLLVDAPLAGYQGDALQVAVKAGDATLSDSYPLTQAMLDTLTSLSAASPAPIQTPGGTDLPTAVPGFFEQSFTLLGLTLNGSLWVIVALGIVLLILLSALLLSARRNKRLAANVLGPDSSQNETEEITQISDPAPAANNQTRVTLEQLGADTARRYTSDMIDTLVIGRVPQKARLVISSDPKISGAHAKLSFSGGQMTLEDLQSTNGTRVNGQLITQPVTLNQLDTLTLGDTAFHISWKRI